MTYKTCVTIAEKTPKKIDLILKKALKKSDYAELRFDFLKPIQVPDALELVKKNLRRCVCTLRPSSEGGKFQGKEKERISILKLIAEYHPFLLDVEFSTLRKNKSLHNYVKRTKTDILVSWHDFKKTPSVSALKKINGFDSKNLTEDIEMGWRILNSGYRNRMCLSARVYCTIPKKFKLHPEDNIDI